MCQACGGLNSSSILATVPRDQPVDAIASASMAAWRAVEFIRVHHEPDRRFPMAFPIPFCRKTTPPRLTSSSARVRTWAWPLTATLTAASSLMSRDNLCPANMSWGCWRDIFREGSGRPRLSTTRALFGTRKTLLRPRGRRRRSIQNGPRLHQADDARA